MESRDEIKTKGFQKGYFSSVHFHYKPLKVSGFSDQNLTLRVAMYN